MLKKFLDFTHKWVNVSGKVAPYTADETKTKLDSQAKELAEQINYNIDELASDLGANHIGTTDRISNPTTVGAELKRLQQYDFEQMVQVNANAELVTSRNGFTTLDDRLDDNDTKRDTNTTNITNLTTDYNAFKGSKGAINGIASLDSNGKVIQTQINGKIDVIYSQSSNGVTTINNIDFSKYRYVKVEITGMTDNVQTDDYLKLNGNNVVTIPYSSGYDRFSIIAEFNNDGTCIYSKETVYYDKDVSSAYLNAMISPKGLSTNTYLPLNTISVKGKYYTLNILGYR